MNSLSSLDALDACLLASHDRPLFIFKHSTACPISAKAYGQVADYLQRRAAEDPDVHLVKVIEDRPVSDQIADQLQVPHKSPQLILVQHGRVLWSTSHYGILSEAMRQAVERLLPSATN
jgi:bacillithiol system protein YtxJ